MVSDHRGCLAGDKMSFVDDVYLVLSADDVLSGLLTGGIYSGAEVREISRQNTPEAFDASLKILPCMLVVVNTDLKSGPYPRSIMTTLSVYFYQLTGYDVIDPAMARTFDLLHDQKVGSNTWNVEFSNSVENQNDIALDCSLSTQRYMAYRMKQAYQAEGS